MHYGHEQKLIHRDVKPENMLLAQDNRVLLSDFGIALVVQSTRFQSTKDAIGTPHYMAPEQLEGKPSRASDQYALAIVIYEWLTGTLPFKGTGREIALQHLSVPPPPFPKNLQISPYVEQVIMTALVKDPYRRFASMQAFALALEKASQGPQHGQFAYISQPAFNGVQSPAIGSPQQAQAARPADLNALYREGIKARTQGDLERTAQLWQQVLDIDPNFGNGMLTPQMEKLQLELHPLRVERLRQQAKKASEDGQWDQEIHIWQTLLGLEPQDSEAQGRITTAEHNKQYVWMYENAQQLVNEKDFRSAEALLTEITKVAPSYGDPAGLANQIKQYKKEQKEKERKLASSTPATNVPAPSARPANPPPLPAPAYNAPASPARPASPPPSALRANNAQAVPARPANPQPSPARAAAAPASSKPLSLGFPPFVSWCFLLCLSGGAGSAIGVLTHSWTLALGVAILTGLIASLSFGYRRSLGFFGSLLAIIIGAAITYSAARYVVVDYTQFQVSHLWLFGDRTVWLIRQAYFGLISGIITGLVVGLGIVFTDEGDYIVDIIVGLFFGAIVALIPLIVALFATGFGWGFGFGFGWQFALLTGFISMLVGAAFVTSFSKKVG